MHFEADGDDLYLVLSPADRRYLGIRPGDRVDMEVVDGVLTIRKGEKADA